jgi:hypothetical protein
MGITVVISYSSVISLIKLSINIAVFGSNRNLVRHKKIFRPVDNSASNSNTFLHSSRNLRGSLL